MSGTTASLVTFAGRYTIERELGSGATSTVYLAHDTVHDRLVALKVLRQDLAEGVAADRFLREIRVNERLNHPRIAPLLDSGEDAGKLYFVRPYMEGGSLRQRLRRERQLPFDAAVAISRSIAEALDYAHARGLIHRDVKPENILFTSDEACLVDFGIARAIERAADESATETGVVRGTPLYMSPAGRGRPGDRWSQRYLLLGLRGLRNARGRTPVHWVNSASDHRAPPERSGCTTSASSGQVFRIMYRRSSKGRSQRSLQIDSRLPRNLLTHSFARRHPGSALAACWPSRRQASRWSWQLRRYLC